MNFKEKDNMSKYKIEDLTSEYEFEIEMSDETYEKVKEIKSELGYVMEDIAISKIED